MRIIAGHARGLKLAMIKGNEIRPTLDRVRESVFNIIAGNVPGARFLDLFAGTGANGIEALSRGAAFCIFVEQAPEPLRIIEKNLGLARCADRAQIRRGILPNAINTLAGQKPFQLIFADPPYAFTDHEQLLNLIQQTGILATDGIFMLEHATKKSIPEAVGPLVRFRQSKYGDSSVSFYGVSEE